jgi:lysophospholipase L1-like esterase
MNMLQFFAGPMGGGISWSAYWATRLPYFALPATGVNLMVGQEVTIYGDSLINVPIDNPLVVTYTCDIGTQVGNNFVITPVAGDVGSHSLRAVFKNGSYTIEDKTIALTVYDEVAIGTKSILMVGDSLTVGGCTYYAAQINAILDSCTFTFLGTQGTTVKHEGRSGAEFNWFIDNASSPLVKAEALDIAAYFTDNSIATPDYVYISLGLNDVFGSCAVAGDGLTSTEITTIINNAKTLIDAFLAFDASLKILLQIPTITGSSATAFEIDYDPDVYSQNLFIENIHKYWVTFIETFADGVYDERVDCSYTPIYLDRDNGYNDIANSGVHPNATGYEQIGVGMALEVNKQISKVWIIPVAGRASGTATNGSMVISCTEDIIITSTGDVSVSVVQADDSTSGYRLHTVTVSCPNDGSGTIVIPDRSKVVSLGNHRAVTALPTTNFYAGTDATMPILTIDLNDIPSTCLRLRQSTALATSLIVSGDKALPTGLTYINFRGDNITWTHGVAIWLNVSFHVECKYFIYRSITVRNNILILR